MPFNLSPKDWTTCLLHADLCQIGALFQKTLVDQVGKLKRKGDLTSQSWELWELLTLHGIVVKEPKLRTKGKKIDKYELYIKAKSFNGREVPDTHTHTCAP